jgi:hypothetical protein
LCREARFNETLLHCFGENFLFGLMNPVNNIEDINLLDKFRNPGTGAE